MATLLRDMTDTQIRAAYGADRFTVTVLASRFRYLIDHICAQLQTNAFSEIIRDYGDMSATLAGPPEAGFPMAAVAQTLPIFFGSMADAVRVALEEYGVGRLRPGDLIMVNDPFRAGTHLNDMCFIRPAFHEGRLAGAITIRAHMLDWGGRVVGGFEATKANLYEDGLVLGPTAIFAEGRPVPSVFSLVMDNTRFGKIVLPDIQTIHHSLELGERLLGETIAKFGYEAYAGAVRYACDASAETMAAAIARVPDGDYLGESRIDCDGLHVETELCVKVRVIKRGARMEFDFSGTSPAPASALNGAWPDLKTTVMVALKMLLDPKSPVTSGAMRDIDILAPPGSLVNALPPSSTNFYFEPMTAVAYAILRALNGALGADAFAPDAGTNMVHQAHGVTRAGQPWFSSAASRCQPAPPWGATREADGDSSQVGFSVNLLDGGVEQREADTPLLIMRREYVADTAGAGFNRGGSASIADSVWTEAGEHRAYNFKFKPRTGNGDGVNGGGDGELGACWLWDEGACEAPSRGFLPLTLHDPIYAQARPLLGVVDPVTNEVGRGGRYTLEFDAVPAAAGSVLRWVCKGAGGWGDPLTRDPERVLRDVRDEYVSIEGAARDYGVVVSGDPQRDPEGLTLDLTATKRLRSARRA
jgi:N-methylhydantoinase B